MKFRPTYVLILTFLFAMSAFAHEYWFEPDTFFLAKGEKTAVHLYVGDGVVKDREERVYQSDKTTMFQLFGISKVWDLKTSVVEGASPVHTFSADRAGNYLFAMERNWSYIKIERQKFEDYLREDGMDYILAERVKLNETEKEGRERYSRFIKSFVQVGGKNDATFKKELGLKFEITPLENPYSKKVGDKLGFQIKFDGKPLADRVVFADNRKSETQRFTTDKNGKFTITLNNSGLWLTRLVIMQRCKTDCGEADWESFWSAFSFGVK